MLLLVQRVRYWSHGCPPPLGNLLRPEGRPNLEDERQAEMDSPTMPLTQIDLAHDDDPTSFPHLATHDDLTWASQHAAVQNHRVLLTIERPEHVRHQSPASAYLDLMPGEVDFMTELHTVVPESEHTETLGETKSDCTDARRYYESAGQDMRLAARATRARRCPKSSSTECVLSSQRCAPSSVTMQMSTMLRCTALALCGLHRGHQALESAK